ncbi:MAG: hypothetical protein SPJ13_01220 [Bacteroidales bacterium]|nr:hypothetical protein [Bacteroidales bacterium]
MKRVISPAKAERIKRHDKICRLYEENVDKYESRTELYNYIAAKVGVVYQTVIRVLQSRNLITSERTEEVL